MITTNTYIMHTKRYIYTIALAGIGFNFLAMSVAAQSTPAIFKSAPDTASGDGFKPHGEIWGQVFGDYYYKAHSDTVGGGRGGSNQYTGIPQNKNAFQFRRIYLGYNYTFSKRFSTEFLLSSEDDFASGDLLQDGKIAPYIKWANIRWKEIYPGADLVIGQMSTPSFSLLTDKVWSYRSVERTVADIRRTPSYDFGAAIQGKFVPGNDNFGYNLMVGNGQTAKPENDSYKWFYGDVYGLFFNRHIIIDLYADYERLNWTPTWHHDRHMLKGFIAYNAPKITAGVEAFVNTIHADDVATRRQDGKSDTLTNSATAVSLYIRGSIYKKELSFFARYDVYNPAGNIDNSKYSKYTPLTTNYDPNTKEQFVSAGLDWAPLRNVHIMPNVWYNTYSNAGPKNYGTANNDYDLVYRLTFTYIFGASPARFNEFQ